MLVSVTVVMIANPKLQQIICPIVLDPDIYSSMVFACPCIQKDFLIAGIGISFIRQGGVERN